MRLKLQAKIFAVFFLAATILILFMVVSLRYFMHRHFTEFINRSELERHAPLRQALAQEYQSAGGWKRLRSDNGIWTDILMAVAKDRYAQRMTELEEKPPDGSDAFPSRPPDPDAGLTAHQLKRFARRLFLLDADKNLLAGPDRPPADAVLQEINLNGRTVGWLGLRRRHAPRTPLEVAFLRRQYTLFYLIGGALLAITALVSYALARHLLAPIKALINGTQALAARRFDTRIRSRSNDELGQLAADFNTMAQTLEKYEQMRRQWMTDIAHELRTPLAVLRGEIEAIQDGVRQVSTERLASLHSEVLHVNRVVEDLHDLSVADSGALVFRREAVRPLEVLANTLAQFQPRLEARRIQIDDQLGPRRDTTLSGDADRFSQLFANLLENTVRYTETGGTLTIGQRQDQGQWILWLEDTGPGVPESSLTRLFDRFYRVDASRNRDLGGSGLGLSICKTIVETMGGRIRADHGAGGGLRIEMHFPLKRKEAPKKG